LVSAKDKVTQCDVTLTTPILGVVCHPKAKTCYTPPVYLYAKYITNQHQPFQRYHWGPQNLKWVMLLTMSHPVLLTST